MNNSKRKTETQSLTKCIFAWKEKRINSRKCRTNSMEESNKEEKWSTKTKLALITINVENARKNKIPTEVLRFNHHSPIVCDCNNLFKLKDL
jgi:hypothetical protein